eukprot:826287-Rhodomonas_salina.1
MSTKDEFIPKLDDLLLRIGKTPSILRSDNAGEMTGEMAKRFYKKNCIVHQTCCSYQHEGNGRAEAAIGNLSSRARALLTHAGMPASYWLHAL